MLYFILHHFYSSSSKPKTSEGTLDNAGSLRGGLYQVGRCHCFRGLGGMVSDGLSQVIPIEIRRSFAKVICSSIVETVLSKSLCSDKEYVC